MIEKILEILETTDYDFRKFTPTNDPLEHLFPEWIKYYQLKYAISKAIQPKSILETGVRFGYSAITFLEGSPKAHYTGIDIDSESYGGVKGAIDWAKHIMKDYKTNFIIADTTLMKSFPGEFYDLIHVDAQQDGDGTFGDLEKALEKGRYVLVDGYFWTKPNMLSSAHFLEKYKNFIEYALIIPGYAGELLIKTKANARNMFSKRTGNYETLEETYDSNYYLNDCGGYDTFLKSNGQIITDNRLLAAIYLANCDKTKSVLDIGSGRGELAYALSKDSLFVVGLDYSQDAINIAKNTYKNINNLEFIQADILKYETNKKFDIILATDVVEHIEQAMLVKMFQKVESLLSENGIFIIHTAPNKLKYLYDYNKKYKLAQTIGTYIPKNPRTYYEDLMHINEQTPGKLNRTLKKYFKTVYTWTALSPNILGDFGQKPTKRELIKNDSIYSICSKNYFDEKIIPERITQQPIDKNNIEIKIDLNTSIIRKEVKAKEFFSFEIELHNLSNYRLSSLLPYPVHISYHWKDKETGIYVIFDGVRTPLNTVLPANAVKKYLINIIAPESIGDYILEITLVQEMQFWFEQIVSNLPVTLEIKVKGE